MRMYYYVALFAITVPPPASVGSLLSPFPSGRRSKAISHYNILLVLSCGGLQDTSSRVQFGFLAHTLRNMVFIFTCPCRQKQPNQLVVGNTPADLLTAMRWWVNVGKRIWISLWPPDCPSTGSVSHQSESFVWLVSRRFISGCHSRHQGIKFVLIKSSSITSICQLFSKTSTQPDLPPPSTPCP